MILLKALGRYFQEAEAICFMKSNRCELKCISLQKLLELKEEQQFKKRGTTMQIRVLLQR